MENNVENKIELKNRLINFYIFHKKKIIVLVIILLIISISLALLKYKIEKNNKLIAEKYVQAGIYLTSNKTNDAKIIFEEIILSKNRFYSILALNTVIEKKLITDKNKILGYFEILEKINLNEENKDLVILKKALYLISNADEINGKALLKNIIDKNSNLKPIAQELINK